MNLQAAVLFFASCLAFSSADTTCGPLEKIVVQMQWNELYNVRADRLALATAVWRNFFHNHGDEVKRFSGVHGENVFSSDFRAHMTRVFSGLDLIIGTITDDAVFHSVMDHYRKMHVGLKVNTAIVKEFGKSMGEVFPRFLHSRPAVDAWRACFELISENITKA